MFTSDDDGQICMNVIIIAEEGDDEIGPQRARRGRVRAEQERTRPPPPGAIANITEYLTGFGSGGAMRLDKHPVARREALYRYRVPPPPA